MGFEILEQCRSNVQAILVPGSEKNLLKALKCSIKSISPDVQIIVSLTESAVYLFVFLVRFTDKYDRLARRLPFEVLIAVLFSFRVFRTAF